MYNKDYSVMQYCDGTSWIAMGNADTGLVGYWRLDETTGTTAIDSSVNSNNGTMQGGLDASNDSITAPIGSGLAARKSTSDYIQIIDPAGGELDFGSTESFSFGLWVNSSTIDDYLLEKGNGTGYYHLQSGNSSTPGQYACRIGDGTTSSAIIRYAATAGEWHHVMCVANRSTNRLYLYIDGIQRDDTDISGVGSIDTGNLAINSRADGTNQCDCDIDEVRIYNRALSVGEITRLYNAGRDRGLIGHWKLDETAGTTAVDSSTLGNDGTYNNVSPVTDSTPAVIDNGIDFSGSFLAVMDAASTPTYVNLQDMTLSAWIRPNSFINFMGIMQVGTVATMHLDFSNNRLDFYGPSWTTGGHWQTFNSIIAENRWSHVATTYSYNDPVGTLPSVYINGVLQVTGVAGAPAGSYSAPATAPTRVGSADIAGLRNFNGVVDDARIYNRILSAAEIQALYREKFILCESPDGFEGEFIYNQDDDVMQFCNSHTWMGMGPAGDGGAGCSNPTGAAGDMIYNDAANVMTYCEGDEWNAIGK